jgi:hypothetical protein
MQQLIKIVVNMKSFYILAIAFSILGCKEHSENSRDKYTPSSTNFENIVGSGELNLYADFDECGEWGGHREEIKLIRERKNIVALFTKDSVNCQNPNGRKVIENKKVILNDEQKEAISIYLHELLNKSLGERVPYHAGEWYSATAIDSSIIITYHKSEETWRGYENLKKSLFK